MKFKKQNVKTLQVLLMVLLAVSLAFFGCKSSGDDDDDKGPDTITTSTGINTGTGTAPTTVGTLKGVVATGFAVNGGNVDILDASQKSLTTVKTDSKGAYSYTVPSTAKFPLLVTATAGTDKMSAIISSSATTMTQHVNPITDVVSETVLGSDLPASAKRELSLLLTDSTLGASYTSQGNAITQKVYGVAFSLANNDTSFAARDVTNPNAIPSVSDTLLFDTAREFSAGQNNLSLKNFITTTNAQTNPIPLTQNLEFQVNLAGNIVDVGIPAASAATQLTATVPNSTSAATISSVTTAFVDIKAAAPAGTSADALSKIIDGVASSLVETIDVKNSTVAGSISLTNASIIGNIAKNIVSITASAIATAVINAEKTGGITSDALKTIAITAGDQIAFVAANLNIEGTLSAAQITVVQTSATTIANTTGTSITNALGTGLSLASAVANSNSAIKNVTLAQTTAVTTNAALAAVVAAVKPATTLLADAAVEVSTSPTAAITTVVTSTTVAPTTVAPATTAAATTTVAATTTTAAATTTVAATTAASTSSGSTSATTIPQYGVRSTSSVNNAITIAGKTFSLTGTSGAVTGSSVIMLYNADTTDAAQSTQFGTSTTDRFPDLTFQLQTFNAAAAGTYSFNMGILLKGTGTTSSTVSSGTAAGSFNSNIPTTTITVPTDNRQVNIILSGLKLIVGTAMSGVTSAETLTAFVPHGGVTMTMSGTTGSSSATGLITLNHGCATTNSSNTSVVNGQNTIADNCAFFKTSESSSTVSINFDKIRSDIQNALGDIGAAGTAVAALSDLKVTANTGLTYGYSFEVYVSTINDANGNAFRIGTTSSGQFTTLPTNTFTVGSTAISGGFKMFGTFQAATTSNSSAL